MKTRKIHVRPQKKLGLLTIASLLPLLTACAGVSAVASAPAHQPKYMAARDAACLTIQRTLDNDPFITSSEVTDSTATNGHDTIRVDVLLSNGDVQTVTVGLDEALKAAWGETNHTPRAVEVVASTRSTRPINLAMAAQTLQFGTVTSTTTTVLIEARELQGQFGAAGSLTKISN